MSYSESTPTGIARGRASLVFKGAVVTAVVLLVVTAVFTIAEFRDRADRYHRVQPLLAHLEAKVNELDALAWEARAQNVVTAESATRLTAINEELTAVISAVARLAQPSEPLEEVSRHYEAYREAVAGEFRLLTAGTAAQARPVDGERLVPAFRSLHAAIITAESVYDAAAERGQRRTAVGAALVFLLATAAIGLLFWRLSREQLASQVAQAGLRLLREANEALQKEVTERQRAERELESSISLLQATLESTADGLLVVNTAGRVVQFNQKFAAMWRLPADLLASREDDQLLAAVLEQLKSPESFLAQVRELYSHPEVTCSDLLEFKDGRLFERYSQPQKIGGKNVGRVWSFRDITERQRAEERLRLQGSALESAANGIVITDPAGKIEWVNPAFTKLTGYELAEVVGQNPRTLKSGRHDAAFYANLWQTILAGQVWQGGMVNKRKDGTLYSEEMTITPVRGAAGEIAHFIAIKQDVTERRKAEASLQLFRSLIDRSDDAFEVVDAETARFMDVNENACQSLGYSREEMLALRVFDVDPTVDEAAFATNRDALRRCGSMTWEGLHRRKDGSTFPVEIHLKYVQLDRAYIVTVARDIAGRKKTEQRTAAFSDLARSLSAVSTRKEAGTVIAQVADTLLGWDSCVLDLYSVTEDKAVTILAVDTIDGRRVDLPPDYTGTPPSPMIRKTLAEGPQLILRGAAPAFAPDLRPFGDTTRPSASLLFAPIRHGAEAVGVLFIQSYAPNAYDQESLKTLQALADHCGGALERLQAQERLRASETLYHSLVHHLPQNIFRKDLTGRFTFGNHRFCQTLGRPLEEIVGKTDFDFYPLALAEKYQQNDRKVLETGDIFETVEEHQLPDGKRAYVQVIKTPLPDAAGRAIGLQGIFWDITERKRAEESLRKTSRASRVRSECNQALVRATDEGELLRQICQIVKNTGGYSVAWVGFAEQDADKSVRIVADAGAKPGFLETLKISWADTPRGRGPTGIALRTGRPCATQDIQDDPSIEPWRHLVSQVGHSSVCALPLLADGRAFGTLTVYSAERDAFIEEEIALLQELAGDLAFGLGAFRTRLAHARAEEEILRLNAELEQRVVERTAQLETANKELEAFSYSVSHDLRAPLRGINGFANILLQDYRDRLDAEGQRLLGVVCAEAQRMGELIDALLTLSRLGRRQMECTELDMTALAHSVVQELTAQDPKRAVEWDLRPLPPGRGDAVLLRQVWVNLLSNALKYTRPRQPAVIEVGGRVEAERTVYYVKDNGAGFDMRYVAKLFGVFQRLHRPEEFPGTGVGLALVQRIVRRHGGEVWAEGQPDAGATFYFALPLQA